LGSVASTKPLATNTGMLPLSSERIFRMAPDQSSGPWFKLPKFKIAITARTVATMRWPRSAATERTIQPASIHRPGMPEM